MKSNETPLYWTLLGLSALFTLCAVATLLPSAGASKPNVLGYRSVCSFAPAASALCGLLAAATCTLRYRLASRSAASARYRPLILPAGAAVLLLAVAVVFGGRFIAAQARFGAVIAATGRPAAGAPAAGQTADAALRDGTRTATVSEGEVSATVEVTVSAGAVSGVRLLAGRNVEPALVDALLQRIRAAGSLSVDAVSGATASSNVVLAAISAAAGAAR
jgi:uncharacterized protein with FMN-binding domain